ncbi:MAG: type IV pilin-like G/H family protein [Gloeomargarita sp. SKYB31]|nr:type IV pilin-like G/H family protein [Gloeomargarita sp. SKYB31]
MQRPLLGAILTLLLGNLPALSQRLPWEPLSRITQAQKTYYQRHRQFTAAFAPLERIAGVSLPRSYTHAIRTTPRGAYIYAIPRNSRLQPMVSAIFLDPAASGPNRMTMVVCQAREAGRFRPADPIFRPGADPVTRKGQIACGDGTVMVDGPFDL